MAVKPSLCQKPKPRRQVFLRCGSNSHAAAKSHAAVQEIHCQTEDKIMMLFDNFDVYFSILHSKVILMSTHNIWFYRARQLKACITNIAILWKLTKSNSLLIWCSVSHIKLWIGKATKIFTNRKMSFKHSLLFATPRKMHLNKLTLKAPNTSTAEFANTVVPDERVLNSLIRIYSVCPLY